MVVQSRTEAKQRNEENEDRKKDCELHREEMLLQHRQGQEEMRLQRQKQQIANQQQQMMQMFMMGMMNQMMGSSTAIPTMTNMTYHGGQQGQNDGVEAMEVHASGDEDYGKKPAAKNLRLM